MYANEHLDTQHHLWEGDLKADETKVEVFSENIQDGVEKGEVHTNMNSSSWSWSAEDGGIQFGGFCSSAYQSFSRSLLKGHVRVVVHLHKPSRRWVKQQDNEPQHQSKWLQTKEDPAAVRWPQDLCTPHPEIKPGLKQFHQGEWSKSPSCACLSLLLPKETWLDIKTKGSLTFPAFNGCVQWICTVCNVCLGILCLNLWLR